MNSYKKFNFQPRTHIIFGENSLSKIGSTALQIGAKRVLLVSDPGVVATGHVERAIKLLEESGINVNLFDQVEENPDTDVVNHCVDAAKKSNIDTLIALGGGSSMDTAKGCNFLLTNGGQMLDYWGTGKATQPMLPSILIPTTAGTGSECQSYALITNKETHVKMACGDPKVAARVAIIDPVLTLSQPFWVTTCCGLDALSHALETAVTKKRNSLSKMFSKEAFKLCAGAFDTVLQEPDNLIARGEMQLGAAFAGIAIENSMLGIAHSMANPLTKNYGIIHGQAVSIMLPHVIRYNSMENSIAEDYHRLALIAGFADSSQTSEQAVEFLIDKINQWMELCKLPSSLEDCGVKEDQIESLAEEAANQWTAQFNPRRTGTEDFCNLYKQALRA